MATLPQLIEKFNEISKDIPESVNLRAYRCLSWLKKADAEQEDPNMRFICLWIAFNAIYAVDTELVMSDKSSFHRFIRMMDHYDSEELYKLTWQRYSEEIRVFIDNKFVFQGFWDFHNGLISEAAWLEDFAADKTQLNKALEQKDSAKLLMILFNRIYTLRNQVFHGGSSYGSKANQPALKNAAALLETYTAFFLKVILENPEDKEWGNPYYPYIRE